MAPPTSCSIPCAPEPLYFCGPWAASRFIDARCPLLLLCSCTSESCNWSPHFLAFIFLLNTSSSGKTLVPLKKSSQPHRRSVHIPSSVFHRTCTHACVSAVVVPVSIFISNLRPVAFLREELVGWYSVKLFLNSGGHIYFYIPKNIQGSSSDFMRLSSNAFL